MPDDIPEHIERIARMLSGGEVDAGGTPFLFVPNDQVVYAAGTSVPLLGLRRPGVGEWNDSLRLPGSDPAHFDYMGTYLTVHEYLPAEIVAADLGAVLQSLADSERRTTLLTALAAVNAISRRPGGYERLAGEYRSALAPELQERFDIAMRAGTGGLGRLVVAPQPILLGMRWLLGRPPRSEPVAPGDPRLAQMRAVLFCHAVGGSLRDAEDERTELTAAEKKQLMLVMMNLGTLGEAHDVHSSIDRTIRLWRGYGHLAVPHLDQTALDLLARATGLEPEDYLAIGFALMAHVRAWEPGKPFLINRDMNPETPPDRREAVLRDLACELEEVQATLGDPLSEFDLLALESRPVVITEDSILVLDETFLWRRCTSGLYWLVHDALKQQDERARHLWTLGYADMVEAMAEDSLRPLAPPVVGAGTSTFYTEDDFEAAYGQIARCDAGIDFGAAVLLVEIVSGQLTVQARVIGDLDKLETDFDRLVFGKCRQLDSTAHRLLADEEPLTTVPAGTRRLSIVPTLVVGGGFPLNMLSYQYIRHRLGELELLQDPRIEPLAILDLEDLEVLEGLGERGHSPIDVLVGWQRSEHRDLPLTNYLIREGVLRDGARPSRTEPTVAAAFEEIFRRLGMPPPPDKAPADRSNPVTAKSVK